MVFDQPTVLFPVSVSFAGLSLGGRGRERKGEGERERRTACEESIFREDCYRVYEEDGD